MGKQRNIQMAVAPATAAEPVAPKRKGRKGKGKSKAEGERKVVTIITARGAPDLVVVKRDRKVKVEQLKPPEQPQVDEKALIQHLRNRARVSGNKMPRITAKMPKLR